MQDLVRRRTLEILEPRRRLDLGLVLTHACNLACVYCYTGEKKRVRMSREVALRALDLGFSAAGRPGAELQLTFFGGEPLLEQELLLEVAGEARERARVAGCRLLLQVTTNGTFLSADLARRLADLDVHVALSLDGTRAQHDAGRPRAGGGSSYDAAMAALGCLVERGRPFDVIAVVDPRNVGDLADGVRELLDRGVDSITLNMNWGGGWDEAALAVFEQQIVEVAAVFVAWLRRGRYVRIQPLEGAVQQLGRDGGAAKPSCRAGTERLAIAPSGRIYPCPRAVGEDSGPGSIGHVDGGLELRGGGLSAHCSCACAEETSDPTRPGPVLLRHDRVVADVARRVSGLLHAEYELVRVVEQGHESEGRGREIPY